MTDLETRIDDVACDWYVSGAHARRALGYLGARLAERGDLPAAFKQPLLLELWGEALAATLETTELSPVSTEGYSLFVNEERTVLVRIWKATGLVEAAFRASPAHTWGPPIVLLQERPE